MASIYDILEESKNLQDTYWKNLSLYLKAERKWGLRNIDGDTAEIFSLKDGSPIGKVGRTLKKNRLYLDHLGAAFVNKKGNIIQKDNGPFHPDADKRATGLGLLRAFYTFDELFAAQNNLDIYVDPVSPAVRAVMKEYFKGIKVVNYKS